MSTYTPGRSQNGAAGSSRPAGPANLSALLAQANSLNDADMDTDLPRLNIGIDEVERQSASVFGRSKKGKYVAGEGHTLLSNLGINTSQLAHTIARLPASEQTAVPRRRRRQPLGARRGLGDAGASYVAADGDLATWSRNLHEMTILSGIEHQRQRTVKAFQQQFQQRILQNWEAEKARILQDELGVTDEELSRLSASVTGNSGLGSSRLGKSSLGASTRRFPMAFGGSAKGSVESREGGLVMHSKMMRYEQVVSELNRRRMRKEPFEVCQALESAVKDDTKYPSLPNSYRILAHMTYEPSVQGPSSSTGGSAPPAQVVERQYASAYLGDIRSPAARSLRERLVSGARSFLEKDFVTHVTDTIAKFPKEAALGGVPGIRNKVRAFVDVQLRTQEAKDACKAEMIDGHYLWAQVYYLLRCGEAGHAMDLIAESRDSLSRHDQAIPSCFQLYVQSEDRRVSKAQRDQLYSDYNSHIRNNPNVDQYKHAIYKIIGRFELNRKLLKVATTTEDWMWLQLVLVRETIGGEPPQDVYDLNVLGKTVLGYQHDKFDQNGQKPFAWFDLLLLTGQFERAIAYLYSKPPLRTDAVHFALTLSYYGLLRAPIATEDAEILSIDEAFEYQVCYINFYRIIKHYIAPFCALEPQTALQYAYLVALGSDAPLGVGDKQRQYALDLVRDVVIYSRAWSKLLGSVRADGTKEAGVIERDLSLLKLGNSEDFLRQIILSAADESALDAGLADSVELYHLAGAYDKVVETVNRALGHSLAQGTQNASFGRGLGLTGAFGGANDLYSLAQKIHQVYSADWAKRNGIPKTSWDTLGLLLQLKLALQQAAGDRPDLALQTLQSTSILPLNADSASIPRHAQKFKDLLDQPSISNLDEVVVTAMKCLHRLSQQLKNSPYGDQARMAQIHEYKQMAQSLIQFASTLRLRLGPDVYRQLSSLSAFF